MSKTNPNHKFRLLRMKSQKQSSALNKLSVKSIVLPEVHEKDDSTISYVKRVGGQVFQSYSLRDMDIKSSDNATYYYLITEMYPLDIEPETSSSKSDNIKVNIYKTKLTESIKDTPISSTGAELISVKVKETIRYTTKTIGKDTHAGKGITSFNLTNVPTIVYSNYTIGSDKASGIGLKNFTFGSKLYPFLKKTVDETVVVSTPTISIIISG